MCVQCAALHRGKRTSVKEGWFTHQPPSPRAGIPLHVKTVLDVLDPAALCESQVDPPPKRHRRQVDVGIWVSVRSDRRGDVPTAQAAWER